MAFLKSKTITLQTLTGKQIHFDDLSLSMSVAALKDKLQNKEGIPPEQVRLVHAGLQLEDNRSLRSHNIGYGATIHVILRLRGGGLVGVQYDRNNQTITIGGLYGQIPYFSISSFHVSCRSDQFTGANMTGIVLYKYDGKTDWKLNGIHCKSGYIVLKLSKNIEHIKGEPGKVHGACYKSVFGKSVDKNKVVGGGFGYVNGVWKFNSWTFNVGSKYHNGNKGMNPMEQQCIQLSVDNWAKSKKQNTTIKEIANKYQW